MTEINYKGVPKINYKTADLSNLQYIKIVFKDINNEIREFKTEISYMSDDYLSLYVKKSKEAEKLKVKEEQVKINEKKLKQANSAFKGMNPWNNSYTTLLLHK